MSAWYECNGSLAICHDPSVKDEKAVDLVKKALSHGIDMEMAGDTINIGLGTEEAAGFVEFDSYQAKYLEDELATVCNRLKRISKGAVWLEGSVDTYGDYDGFVDVTRDRATLYDLEDRSLVHATDETLIDMLRKRGYVVTKKKARKGGKARKAGR